MRFLVYNIAYGTGAPEAILERFWTMHRYLRASHTHLEKILKFIEESNPDVIGLIEVDTGSYRTNYNNQVEIIANHINHQHCCSIKYGRRFLSQVIPILKNQANAILTRKKIPQGNFHFLPVGFKKLIIEVIIDDIRFFLVHLALQKKTRQLQLSYLEELARGKGPVIIAGDFNTFTGEKELNILKNHLRLVNPNHHNIPTFPSWKPKRQLDFILCSKSLKISNFKIPNVKYSDHLPLILDVET